MANGRASSEFNNSSSEYLQIPNGSSGPHDDLDGGNTFTHSVWLKLAATGGGNKKTVHIGIETTFEGYYAGSESSGSQWGYVIHDNTSFEVLTSSTNFNTNWHHRLSTSRANNDHELYLDGISRDTSTTSRNPIDCNISNIAARDNASGLGEYYDGYMAYAAVYETGFTADKMGDIIYNPWSYVDGIIWFPNLLADGSVVGDFVDQSGKGYDPVNGNVPSAQTDGPPVYHWGAV